MDPYRDTRIVGSGLSRTGTRSVFAAILDLGVSAVHYPFDHGTQAALTAGAPLPVLVDHRVILDISAAAFFEQIAGAYPDGRVLHTTRDREQWLDATMGHYDRLMSGWPQQSLRFREFGAWITERTYGSFPVTRGGLADAFDRQEERVAHWQRQYPDRFLSCNVFSGEGAQWLAAFVGAPTDAVCAGFPRVADVDEVTVPGRDHTVLNR